MTIGWTGPTVLPTLLGRDCQNKEPVATILRDPLIEALWDEQHSLLARWTDNNPTTTGLRVSMSVTDEPANRTASDCPPNTLIIVLRNRIIGPYHALGQSVH